MKSDQFQEIAHFIDSTPTILIVQADNPDADSLGTAAALEEILAARKLNTIMYCGVTMPSYLHYIESWSRVTTKLPQNFDLVIIVDASTTTLLEKIKTDDHYLQYVNTPKIVLDHHETTDNSINASLAINDPEASSTSELLYEICTHLKWEITPAAAEYITCGILGDTQGLSNSLASAKTHYVVGNLIELGVNRQLIEEKRRSYNRFHPDIYKYKGKLIERTTLTANDSIAYIVVPQDEIVTYSPLYNPAALIQQDMLQIEGVHVSIVFKSYSDGKITAAIRTNSTAPIAAKIAEEFGGGGHDHAAGFKINECKSFEEIENKCIRTTVDLLQGVKNAVI